MCGARGGRPLTAALAAAAADGLRFVHSGSLLNDGAQINMKASNVVIAVGAKEARSPAVASPKPSLFGGFGAKAPTIGTAELGVAKLSSRHFGAKPAMAGLAAKPAAGGFGTPKGKKKGPVKAVFQDTNVRRPPLPARNAPHVR